MRDDASRDLLRQASSLFRAGRYAEAVPAYQRLLAVDPNLPNSWFNLAISQRHVRRFHDALASYGRALELGIDEPEEVHLQRGVIFSDDLGDSDAAARDLARALALNPDYVPALLNLGNLHEDRGDRDDATAAYAHVLALDPQNVLALSRMVGLARIDDEHAIELERVRAAMERVDASPADRADLGFALGGALDRLGHYDRAFEAYREANAVVRQLGHAAGLKYDRAAQEALIDRIIAAFPARPRDRSSASTEGPTPLFICGMFRSGSTLAEHILARHSNVVAGGEIDMIPALVAQMGANYPEAVAGLTDQEIAVLRRSYLDHVEGRHGPGTILTDKRPDNFLHVGFIKTLFPDARIVHTTRDLRDNCLSVYFLHASPALAYATDLGDIAHYRQQEQRLMTHWRRCYSDEVVEVDYDRLVAEPRPQIEALLAFCRLAWQDQMSDHAAAGHAVRTASNWQVRQPLYRRSSGRWRNYEHQMAMLFPD